MRPGTTIVVAVLLFGIFLAAVLNLVVFAN